MGRDYAGRVVNSSFHTWTSVLRPAQKPVEDRLARVAGSRYLGAMASNGTAKRSGSNGQFVTVRGKAKRGSKVKFGSVTISGAKPSKESVKGNVERSTKALERVTKKLSRPGVTIREKAGVPQFYADEGEKGVFIRRLDGRIERGRLIDGHFRVIK